MITAPDGQRTHRCLCALEADGYRDQCIQQIPLDQAICDDCLEFHVQLPTFSPQGVPR